VSGRLREIAAPFVVAAPAGARVRTRLRVTSEDAVVLRAAGMHLGSLASADLAARCAEGRLDGKGKAASRAERKRALTAHSSSRWAGAITRSSEDQQGLAERNLKAGVAALRARVRKIEARLAVPAGGRRGRIPGYATQAERHGKQQRLQALRARLAKAERQLDPGRVSVCRGGRDLLRKRNSLASAGLTAARWRQRWDAARMFLTADGEAGKLLGNETIRWNPGGRWLELKLPAPLSHLANSPHGRYRLMLAGIPTGKFRDRLAQMASNAGLTVIAVDPAYTSRWGAEHWLAPLREQDTITTGHHAAAVVIGRRAQGHTARRREGVTGGGQRTASRRAAPTAPAAPSADRNGRPRKAQRQPPRWRKTATADRAPPPDQATHDRSGPPAEQHSLPLSV
jgi:hypothetical protein